MDKQYFTNDPSAHNCFNYICKKCSDELNDDIKKWMKTIDDLKYNNYELAEQNTELKQEVSKLKQKCADIIKELYFEIQMERGTPRNKETMNKFTEDEYVKFKMNN